MDGLAAGYEGSSRYNVQEVDAGEARQWWRDNKATEYARLKRIAAGLKAVTP